MIRDTGVRVIVAGGPPAVYPDQRFVLRHTMAARQCAAHWRELGMRNINIPKLADQIQGVPWVISATRGAMKAALTAEGIRVVEAYGNGRPLSPYLRSLGASRS